MNKAESPCIDKLDYKYHECISQKIITEVGCKPFWMNDSKSLLSECSKMAQVMELMDNLSSLKYMHEEHISHYYNCLKPCSYIEYQLAEEPMQFESKKKNVTEIFISFSRTTMTVEKEIDAYPAGSFVAEYGGLLGLFIGYSFLDHFDQLVFLVQKLKLLRMNWILVY